MTPAKDAYSFYCSRCKVSHGGECAKTDSGGVPGAYEAAVKKYVAQGLAFIVVALPNPRAPDGVSYGMQMFEFPPGSDKSSSDRRMLEQAGVCAVASALDNLENSP